MNLSGLFVFGICFASFCSVCLGIRSIQSSRRNRYRSSLRRITCTTPNITNGYFIKRRDILWTFYCDPDFKLIGKSRIGCKDGRFDNEIPVCARAGCNTTMTRPNGIVQLQKDSVAMKLSCKFGFDLAGSEISYCDGERWDRELGECRPDIGHKKVCDFETADLCGWTQNQWENDFLWRRRNGWNAIGKLKFGPKHDHTTGKPLEGYYMVAEGTNALTEQKSRFWSPIHRQADSVNACFRFYYHMFGAYVGRLRVIVKPIDRDLDEIANDKNFNYFENEHSSNEWYEGFFDLKPTPGDFQIVFEATVAGGRICDIAIDDVSLLHGADCTLSSTSEATTDESDGIYDLQSCKNRCNETESAIMNALDKFIHDENYNLIERCDCHFDCDDMDTCCPDYQLQCNTSQLVEWLDGWVNITSTDYESMSTHRNVPLKRISTEAMKMVTLIPPSDLTRLHASATSKMPFIWIALKILGITAFILLLTAVLLLLARKYVYARKSNSNFDTSNAHSIKYVSHKPFNKIHINMNAEDALSHENESIDTRQRFNSDCECEINDDGIGAEHKQIDTKSSILNRAKHHLCRTTLLAAAPTTPRYRNLDETT